MDPRETRLFGFVSFHNFFRTIFEFKIKPLSEDRNIYLCMKIKQSMNPGESAMFDVKTPMSYYVQCVMT